MGLNNMKKTISVIGLGYVGLPLALLADKKGYRVIGIDTNRTKIDQIKNKISPFVDENVQRDLQKSNLEITTDSSKIEEADIVVICVPTPVYENYMPNLEPVEGACKSIAPYLKDGALVILESTVNPGVSEGVVLPILEEISGKKVGKDIYLAHCPERINPGDPTWNVENIPRVVGSSDKNGLRIAVDFYKNVLVGSVKPMGSLKEAEACKVVENSFRDINIAFVNELAKSFTRLGIDVKNVIDGAATKPFAFMAHYPSCGVGGHCIPVDPYYLIEYAKKNGFYHEFLSVARRINNSMPVFTVDVVADALNELEKSVKNTKVAVLGLAYKGNISDDRESPSYDIIKELKRREAEVIIFDPYLKEKSTVQSLNKALSEAEVIVVATNHDEFKDIPIEDLSKNNIKAVVDGKNCLDKEAVQKQGIVYKGIGR